MVDLCNAENYCIDALYNNVINVEEICSSCEKMRCNNCDLYHTYECFLEENLFKYCFYCERYKYRGGACDNCIKLSNSLDEIFNYLTFEEIIKVLKLEKNIWTSEILQLNRLNKEEINKIRYIIKRYISNAKSSYYYCD